MVPVVPTVKVSDGMVSAASSTVTETLVNATFPGPPMMSFEVAPISVTAPLWNRYVTGVAPAGAAAAVAPHKTRNDNNPLNDEARMPATPMVIARRARSVEQRGPGLPRPSGTGIPLPKGGRRRESCLWHGSAGRPTRCNVRAVREPVEDPL